MSDRQRKGNFRIKERGKWLIVFFAIALFVVVGIYKTTTNHQKTMLEATVTEQMEEMQRIENNQEQDIEVGQNAVISSIEMVERKTGEWSYDENDEPGNDSSSDNDIVLSFDTIKYTMNYNMQLKSKPEEENEPIQEKVESYKGGVIEVRAELPEDCVGVAEWDVNNMTWAKNGQLSEDKRIFTAKYAMPAENITIPGVQSLKFALKVLAAPNGKEIIPTFTSKLVGNLEGEEISLTDEPVRVSAVPSYNIQLTKKPELNYRGYFDPDTKNEVAEPTDSSIFGRMQGYAITLQLYNSVEGKGLKGIELPQGDITFDLTLEEYNGNNNLSQNKGYTPILWDYSENEQFETGNKGNNLVWNGISNSNFGYQIAPYNSGGRRDSCYNGGSWKIIKDESKATRYHVTIQGYKFDMENFEFPTKNAEDPVLKTQAYQNNVGCFSAGYVQAIMQMPEKADSIKNIEMRATVSNLHATSVTNQKTTQDKKSEDDISKTSITLYPEGNYNKNTHLCKSNQSWINSEHLASHRYAGDANIALGESVYIIGNALMGGNNDITIHGINVLQKFDDKAFYIPEDANSGSGTRLGPNGSLTTLYAGKPDKTGWKDDEEMQNTREQDLVYFTSMFELQEEGFTCVGVLFEDRGVEGKPTYDYYYGIRTFIKETAEIGKVYQTVNDVTVWKEETDFTWANKKYTYDEQNGLVYEELNAPEPLATEYNGKNANTPMYVKTQYDENGQIITGTHNGTRSGNSILITGADLSITKTSIKQEYNLSGKEYDVTFEIQPKLKNRDNEIKGIHLKITDTLPKGLSYGTGTCNYDEPEVTINEDGTTTLVWYVYNCTVNQEISPITYTAYIDKNTKDKTTYTSKIVVAEILNDGEKTKIGNSRIEKRTNTYTITINNSASYSLYKTTTTPGIEENGEIHYKIVACNNTNTNLDTFKLFDELPMEKDKNWIGLKSVTVTKTNQKSGQMINNNTTKLLYSKFSLVKEVEIEESEEPTTPTTPPEEIKPIEVPIKITDEDFGETPIWEPLESGAELPADSIASAIALKGVLEANTKIEIDIILKTKNNKTKDSYKNRAIMHTVSGQTLETLQIESRVVNRVILGKVWEDYDRNGLMDYFEEKMINVPVILYDSMNNEILTTKTDSDGNYRFDGLAKGNYKVKIVSPEGYYVTQKKVGNLPGINSKFDPMSQTTDLIELSATSESMSVLKYNINAGLYRERYRLHITNYATGTKKAIKNAIYAITGEGIGLQGPDYKTNEKGQFDVLLVPDQIYTMQQTEVSNYDYMLNEIPITFSVTKINGKLQWKVHNGVIKTSRIEQVPNEGISDVYIEIENEPKYSIRLTKYEKNTNHTISYVRFRVKGKGMGEEGRVFQTNVNGIATITSLGLNETYTVEEEYAKGYYYKGREFTLKMTRDNEGKLQIEYHGVETIEEPYVEETESKPPVVVVNLDNVNIPKYTLQLNTIAEKTGKKLENAHFEIQGEGRDEAQEKQYITNKDGSITIEKLYENEIYILKQVVPPVGYKLKEETLKFKVTQKNGVWNFEILEGQLLQEPTIEGSKIKINCENELLFKLQKTDQDTGEPLAGVKFTVKDLEGKEAKDLDGNPVGKVENINGQDMRVITSDENGFYTAEIAQGLYQIEEVQTIFGYDLPEKPVQYFGIDSSREGKEDAVETWATEFSTANSDIVERVAITSDGGRVFGGQLGGMVGTGGGSIGDSGTKTYVLVKYDPEGKLVWNTTCNYDYINYVKETRDGGLLVVANEGVMKYQKAGEAYTLEWESTVSTSRMGSKFVLRYIDETDDDGFIVAGQFTEDVILKDITPNLPLTRTGVTDIFVLKYKKIESGYQLEWTTTVYGSNTNSVFITALMATSDGGFIVGGATNGNVTLPNGEVLTNSGTTDNTILLKYDKSKKGVGYEFNWGKRIHGSTNRITGITETTDGEYIVAGYFNDTIQLSNSLQLHSNGQRDNLVVKYDKFGNIRFGFNIGGVEDEIVNHVDRMTDGGFTIAGSMASRITLENGQIINPQGDYDAFVARFDKDAHLKWAKLYGGVKKDYFTCLDINEEGRILLGTLFNSESLTLNNGQVLNGIAGNVDAGLIEIQEIEVEPEIPETSEVNYQNSKHQYQITTEVKGTGGTISGENEQPYEQVKYTEDSQKDIIITPKEGYEVSSVKINEQEINFIRNDDATVILDKFTNIQEDKHIVVKFTANPAEVIVHHYILNTTRSLAPDEVIRGEVDKEYETKPKKDIEKYELDTTELPQNAKGIMTAETIEVFYYYSRRDAKVIVHHYLDGTTEELAQDEEIEGRIGSEYETQNATISGYEVVREKWPSNSKGSMQERETQVVYYYIKKTPQIVTNTVSKQGTKVMETENQPIEYTLTYHAEIADVLGNAKITLIDYLPYEIDEENSNLDGGIYNQEEKTITWEETKEKINTYQNGNESITMTKHITVVFRNMNYGAKSFMNYAEAKITIDDVQKETGKIPARTETNFTKNVIVTKRWDHTNNQYQFPQCVRYQVKYGENIVAYKDLTTENRMNYTEIGENEEIWQWEFTNLEKYDEQGNEIDYQVEETEIKEGDLAYYQKDIDQKTKTITNTYIGPIISANKTSTTSKGLDYVVEGEKITYTITVENAGRLEKDIVIKDTIPEGTTFVEDSIQVNNEPTDYTKQDLEEGITVKVAEKQEETVGRTMLSFSVTVDKLSEGKFEAKIRNTAYVDNDPISEETENTVKKSSIKATKESNPTSGSKVKLGDKITYVIRLQNEGNIYGDILVKDRIPEGTTFVEGTIKINGQSVEKTKQDLEKGMIVRVPEKQGETEGETTISFEVTVNQTEDMTPIRNMAQTTTIPDKLTNPEDPEIPIDPEEPGHTIDPYDPENPINPEEPDKPTNKTENIYVQPIIEGQKIASSERGLDYVVEGEKITYIIIAENKGGLAKETTIKDTVPEGTTLVEGSIKINGETTTNSVQNLVEGITVNVPEKIGTQNGRTTISFEVTVNPLAEGTFVDQIRNTAYIDDIATPKETENQVKKSNIKATKESNPVSGSKVKLGDKITYTIKLENEGSLYGDRIVKDTIPEGTTLVENSIRLNGQVIEKTKEDLMQGIVIRVPEKQGETKGEATISFEVIVNDGEDRTKIKNMAFTTKIPDKLTNPEEPEKPTDLEEPDIPTNETENTYIEPIIITTKTATTEEGLSYVVEGEKITYTITVENEGGLAKDVIIKDKIPEGTTLVEGSIQINHEMTTHNSENLEQGISVNVPEKQEETNGRAILSFCVTVNKGATGNIRNQARIDDKITNEVSYPIINFEKQVEINKISEEDLPENTVTTTDQIIYKIIVRNTGTSMAQSIEVKDSVPEGTTIEQINNQGKMKDSREIVWNLEEIGAGETKELSFVVNVKYNKEEKKIKNIAYINNKPTNETSTDYKKTESKLKTTISKTGDNQIISTDCNIYYEINYRAIISDLKGKASITIVDQLPYPIDVENSDLSGGVYDAKTKTITWQETEENIDTYEAEIEKTIQKTIAISVRYLYIDPENLSGTIENTVKATTQLKEPKADKPEEDEIVRTEEKTDKHDVLVQIPAQVLVHHYIYDEDKKQYTTVSIAEDEIKNGKIGENYTTTKSDKVPQNYECINETPEKYVGTMTKTPIEVTYYYRLKSETVENKMTKTAKADKTIQTMEEEQNITTEVIQTEGNTIQYKLSYKIVVKDYIGKVKIQLKDVLPEKINVEQSNLSGGIYDEQSKTITWEQTIENIDTFANGTYENTMEKQIEILYEGQNKIERLTNTAEGSVTTYYPENHVNKPGEEKETIKDSDETVVQQNYKTDITVEKIWEDNENRKNHRPESIKIQLKANKQNTFNGEELEAIILSEDNHWSHTFENLDQYDSNGREIHYEVEEQEIQIGDLKYYNEPEIVTTDGLANKKMMVTNSYKLKDITIDSNLTKDGTEEITSSTEEVNYHISYHAVVKEYIGDAVLVITDTLPYQIDEEKSDLSNGVYNKDTKTITWTIPLNNIDTSINGDCEVGLEGDIKLVYKDLDAKQVKITNYLKAKIEFTEDDTKNEVEDSHDTVINIRGKVKVKYIDKDTGKDLTLMIDTGEGNKEEKYEYEIEGKAGEEYTTKKHEIDTYDYVETIGIPEGEIQEGETEVIYYYTKSPSGGVTIKYVDENGKEIVPKEEIAGKIGEEYTTKEKDIENYEFVETTGDETEGILTKEPKEIYYHYKKIPATVLVKYLEKETNQMVAEEETIKGYAGDSYKTQRKVVKDYQKVEPEPENATGTMKKEIIEVIYYYEKIPSGKVTVKYVDMETGEEIVSIDENGKSQKYSYESSGFVGEKYKTEEKDIPYYVYQNNVEESQKEAYYTQNDETIIYYYKKLKFNIGIQKEIKEAYLDGNPIKISKDNKMMKVELVKNNIPNANLQITYSIRVSNTEELSGTAILYEMIPTGFTLVGFDKNCWQVHEDGNLSMTLELNAGESRVYELTFQWNNNESNFGTKTNKVAIVKTMNEANFSETTSEDNQSEATAIINIKTGKEWSVWIGILSSMILIGGIILSYHHRRKTK
ncbi:MAG: DUF11 domain-containing protein [Clostridia bacterium]|nr:DUF11 domain-containing protein [Clostridia bacterium]